MSEPIRVLDHGFVRSLERIERAFEYGYSVDAEHGHVFGLKGQKLIPQKIYSGHLSLTLQTPGLGRPRNESIISVHSMIAFSIYGRPAFQKGLEIRHLNNIPDDNRGINLAPGTRRQNFLDLPEDRRKEIIRKRAAHLIGKPNCQRKLSDEEVLFIRDKFNTNQPRGEITRIARVFGVSHPVVVRIIRNQSYAI